MKLFKKLASVYSGSHAEEPMRRYIKRWVGNKVPGASVRVDQTGNVYIVKGEAETYPCVVAHLDQVQDEYPSDYKVVETPDVIFGYSPSSRSYCGLGADDKCGIWIALKMLLKHDAIKVAFFVGEEIGCVGSRRADMDFFKDVRFVIEPDRRGSSDLITEIGLSELCSDEFIADISPESFGYSATRGMMTDVEALKERGLAVSCINMSCGYYEPHTDNEYVVKADMVNACNFVDSIIRNCTKAYPHEPDNDRYDDSFYYGTRRGSKAEKDYIKSEQWEWAFDTMCQEIENGWPDITVTDFLDAYSYEFDMLEYEDVAEILEICKEYYKDNEGTL